MSEFVAIDFETANESRDSACEVALVRFKDGLQINSFSSLIYQERFAPFNTLLHGITPKLVKKAPNFKAVWEDMKQFIGSSPLIAHNASFDISVLYKSLNGEPLGTEIDYFCTMVISKRMLDLTYFGLPGVASHLEVDYPMEHRAESDSVAAGKVASALLRLSEVDTLHKLANKLNIQVGILSEKGPSGFTPRSKGLSSSLSKADKERLVSEIGIENFYEDPDFAGKRVVFTGELVSMSRREAETAVMKAGGIPVSSVSSKTNMVIFGWQDPSVLRGKPLSSKRLKADELRATGADIEVVDEAQFLEMLRDPQ